MISHEQMVDEVAARARLDSKEAGLRAVRVTLAALSCRLEMPQRQRLRQALPGSDRDAAYAGVRPPKAGQRSC